MTKLTRRKALQMGTVAGVACTQGVVCFGDEPKQQLEKKSGMKREVIIPGNKVKLTHVDKETMQDLSIQFLDKKVLSEKVEVASEKLVQLKATLNDGFYEIEIPGLPHGTTVKFKTNPKPGRKFDHLSVVIDLKTEVTTTGEKYTKVISRSGTITGNYTGRAADRGPCCVEACGFTVCGEGTVCIICDGLELCCNDPP